MRITACFSYDVDFFRKFHSPTPFDWYCKAKTYIISTNLSLELCQVKVYIFIKREVTKNGSIKRYIETIGEYYLKILLNVLENLSDEQIKEAAKFSDVEKDIENFEKK